jgi:uncharacterized membrane protein YdbT with pleckstrin-like domain
MSNTSEQVARVIQLAVAPVFLLTAIGTLLSVLSSRLARIIDRARVLAERLENDAEAPRHEDFRKEMAVLIRRRQYVNVAITSGVASALLICILMASAFVAALIETEVSTALVILFVAAMGCLVLALLLFLREVLISALSYRIDVR